MVVLVAPPEVRHLGMIRHLARVLLLRLLVVVEVATVVMVKMRITVVLVVVVLTSVCLPVLVIHHLHPHHREILAEAILVVMVVLEAGVQEVVVVPHQAVRVVLVVQEVTKVPRLAQISE